MNKIKQQKALEERKSKWDPLQDPNCTSDPYKTLFVGRLVSDRMYSHLKNSRMKPLKRN